MEKLNDFFFCDFTMIMGNFEKAFTFRIGPDDRDRIYLRNVSYSASSVQGVGLT
jgi:hypothetical protein